MKMSKKESTLNPNELQWFGKAVLCLRDSYVLGGGKDPKRSLGMAKIEFLLWLLSSDDLEFSSMSEASKMSGYSYVTSATVLEALVEAQLINKAHRKAPYIMPRFAAS